MNEILFSVQDIMGKNKLRKRLIITLIGLGLFAILLPPGQFVLAETDSSVSLGTAVVSEGHDFATRVLGLPWNMSTNPYPDYPTTLKNFYRNLFRTDGDVWYLRTASEDPKMWMHSPSIVNTQKVLKLGDQYPIDAGKYSLLSFKMCSEQDDFLFVYWMNKQFFPGMNPAVDFFRSDYVKVKSGCHLYTIDMSQIETFNGGWDGMLTGLRIDPGMKKDVNIQFDWIRLTAKHTNNIASIDYDSVQSGSRVNFYLNQSACSLSGADKIGSIVASSRSGTFQWSSSMVNNPEWEHPSPYPLPESFEPGRYYVIMESDGSQSCADERLEIRQAPTLTFQKPTMWSGPDYAWDNVQNLWGMADDDDINVTPTSNILNYSFSDSVFHATTQNRDSKVFLNNTTLIDTNKYHYITYRYKIDGYQDIGGGWSTRFIWWYTQPAFDQVTLDDVLAYEGWKVYSFDLKEAVIDPATPNGEWSGLPRVFRFDLHEIPDLANAHLDFMKLTGDEVVQQGEVFPIYYQKSREGVTASVYYDTNRNRADGRNLAERFDGVEQITNDAPFSLFLPALITQPSGPGFYEIDLLDGEKFDWNTSGVNPGGYFISIDLNDGVNTTTWYSDVPVYIVP